VSEVTESRLTARSRNRSNLWAHGLCLLGLLGSLTLERGLLKETPTSSAPPDIRETSLHERQDTSLSVRGAFRAVLPTETVSSPLKSASSPHLPWIGASPGPRPHQW
jgi:hypothetical protein